MAFVITEKCLSEVYASCQQVCPADCIHFVSAMPDGYPGAGRKMMVIDPDECIDCTLCEPECPVEAIFSEEELPADQLEYKPLNAELARKWPVITEKGEPPADAKEWEGKPGKKDLLER